jgi:hypothetical protein
MSRLLTTGINGNAVKVDQLDLAGSISRLTTVSQRLVEVLILRPMMEDMCPSESTNGKVCQWLQGVHVATCRVIYIQCN